MERVIKIPPSLMLQSWMGSDFTNDDLVKESSLATDYTHRIEGETTEDGDPCYRLIATPKPDAPVVWGKLVLLIRKADFLPRREEFYDEQGALQKTLYFDNIRRTGSRNYPMRWRMVSHTKPGHETTLTFSSLEFDKPIPANTIHAAESRAAFLRGNDALLANGMAQRLEIPAAISADRADHRARAGVQHPDARHRRRLS